MAKKVRVILLEDVETVGRAGDIVAVAEGYARNFLFNEGKAALADHKTLTRNEVKKQHEAAARAVATAQLQERAEGLEGTELVIVARVKDGDDIFGTVTTKTIAGELKKQAQLVVKPAAVSLAEPIKKLGSTEVTISLSPDVDTHVRVTVVPDPKSQSVPDPED